MAKNLIPEIAQMLGVELNEEFKIKGYDGLTYEFVNYGLKLRFQEETYSLGPCLDSALIAAANKSIKAFRNLQNELNSGNSVQKSNEDAEK